MWIAKKGSISVENDIKNWYIFFVIYSVYSLLCGWNWSQFAFMSLGFMVITESAEFAFSLRFLLFCVRIHQFYNRIEWKAEGIFRHDSILSLIKISLEEEQYSFSIKNSIRSNFNSQISSEFTDLFSYKCFKFKSRRRTFHLLFEVFKIKMKETAVLL